MNFTKDDALQMVELSDSELNEVAGAGGFGACGACGFGVGPFVTQFSNFNAVNFAVSVNVNVAVSTVNQNAFLSEFN